MKLVKVLFASFLLVGLCSFTGCGKDKDYRAVTGTVTMGGAPLEGCILTFFPENKESGEGGSAKTDASGAYSATSTGAENGGTGLKPGVYSVAAMKNEEVKDPDQEAFDKGEITYDELQERKQKKGAYAKSAGGELLTPRKFLDPNLTPLKITVTNDPKANVFDFNLDE